MLKSKDKKTLDEFLKLINSINDNEKDLVIGHINKKITPFKDDGTKRPSDKKVSPFKNDEIIVPANLSNKEEIICPNCGSSATVRYGTFDKKQRYRCKGCSKTFTITTGSIRYQSKSSEKTWDIVLKGMIEDHTNEEIADDYGVFPSTVHTYRHKVMKQTLAYIKNQSLTGIVESDEFYSLPNFKGSKKKYIFNFGKGVQEVYNIPDYERYGLKSNTEIRGTKMLRGLSNDKVCYSTAISHANTFCGKPINWGNISATDIQSTLLKNLTPKAIFVGDRSKTNQHFVKEYKFENHLLEPDGEGRYGEIYNLQKINSFHSKMKKRIKSNRSFATKYAEEYIAWFAWLLQVKDKTRSEKIVILKEMIEIGSKTATWDDIKSMEFPMELRKN